METIMLETIFSRRSIRKYSDTAISEEITETLLKAGMSAPSARNNQACRFIVIKDKAMLKTVSDLRPAWKPLAGAALGIIVLADTEGYTASIEYITNDCAACTENILLAAHALGLGGCWLGCATKEAADGVSKTFDLPNTLVPCTVISLGYPGEERPAHSEFDMTRVIKYC